MRRRPPLRDDRRGVSSALGYVLTLAISGILVTGLLVAGGSMVTTERDVVAREQLSVAAEQLATGMTDADRMANTTSEGGTVRIQVWLPNDAGSAPYSLRLVSVTDGPPYTTRLVAELRALDISRSVVVRTSFDVAESTVDGGPVVVTFDDEGNGKLHVHDADDVAMNLGGATLSLSPPTGGVSQLSVGDVPSSAASGQAAAFDATTGDIS